MMNNSFSDWFHQFKIGDLRKSRKRNRQQALPSAVVQLEPRLMLTECIWTGGSILNDKWSTPQNWDRGIVPKDGDTVVFNKFVGNFDRSTINDLPAGTHIAEIDFDDTSFTISGNAIQTSSIRVRHAINGPLPVGTVLPANVIDVDISVPATSSQLSISLDSSEVLHLTGKISGSKTSGLAIIGSYSSNDANLVNGTVFLTGSKSNSFGGRTLVQDAVLGVARTAGTTTIPGDLTISNVNLLAPGQSQVVLHQSNQIADSAVVSLSGKSTLQYLTPSVAENITSLSFQGNGSRIAGNGTLGLSGNISFPALTTDPATAPIQQAEINLAKMIRSGIGNMTFDVGLNRQLTLNAALSGSVAVTKTGDGSLTFSGAGSNTYSGNTRVLAGKLGIFKNDFVIAIPGNIVVGNATAAPTPDNITPKVSLVVGGNENIVNTSVITVNPDGLVQATNSSGTPDEVVTKVVLNGGRISSNRDFTPATLTVGASPLGSLVLGPIHLPGNRPASGVSGIAVFDVADSPVDRDLRASAISGNGSWVKKGTGTMFSATGDSTAVQDGTLVEGTLILEGLRSGTSITVTGGTLQGSAFFGGLRVTGGIVDSTFLTATGDTSFTGESHLRLKISQTPAASSRLVTTQAVTLGQFNIFPFLDLVPQGPIALGTKFTVIDVASNQTVSGFFRAADGSSLDEGETFTAAGQQFTITYHGGTDGHDIVVTRNNGPAFVNRSFPQVIMEGETATLRGTITEPDRGDTFFLDINWGDGKTQTVTVPPGSNPNLAIDHQYLKDGRFVVSMNWHDQNGGGNRAETRIVVRNAPPALQNVAVTTPIVAGQSVKLVGIAHDPGENDKVTVTVFWGDGTGPEKITVAADGSFSATHRYARPGKRNILLFARDEQIPANLMKLVVDVKKT